jgi:hypothetical protein
MPLLNLKPDVKEYFSEIAYSQVINHPVGNNKRQVNIYMPEVMLDTFESMALQYRVPRAKFITSVLASFLLTAIKFNDHLNPEEIDFLEYFNKIIGDQKTGPRFKRDRTLHNKYEIKTPLHILAGLDFTPDPIIYVPPFSSTEIHLGEKNQIFVLDCYDGNGDSLVKKFNRINGREIINTD